MPHELSTTVYADPQTSLLRGTDERPDAPFTALLMTYECNHGGRSSDFINPSSNPLASTNVMGILLTYFTVTLVDVVSGLGTELKSSQSGKAGHIYLDKATGAALAASGDPRSVPIGGFIDAVAHCGSFSKTFFACAVAGNPAIFAPYLKMREDVLSYAASTDYARSIRDSDRGSSTSEERSVQGQPARTTSEPMGGAPASSSGLGAMNVGSDDVAFMPAPDADQTPEEGGVTLGALEGPAISGEDGITMMLEQLGHTSSVQIAQPVGGMYEAEMVGMSEQASSSTRPVAPCVSIEELGAGRATAGYDVSAANAPEDVDPQSTRVADTPIGHSTASASSSAQVMVECIEPREVTTDGEDST